MKTRFILRNQHKIKEAYGDKMLKRIMDSLKSYFDSGNIESHLCDSDKYKTIFIDDTGHTSNMIAFYVLRIQFDVYNLAFKEFVG
ncbi:MAG: hypothetical protein V3W20_02860 [Candidatus Neomarinimicrobiota bacterium]